MKKIIFDCDNTMGLENHPLDDGLALMHLLGTDDVEILGITTTFGNADVDTVYKNTKKMIRDLGLDIKVFKGGRKDDRNSESGRFLVEMADKYKGELIILGIGSMANIYEAYLRDNSFFDKLGEIVLMGGIEEPLIIKGKQMDELNFSCDYEASYNVLKHGKNITIMTGHIGLNVKFDREDYKKLESIDSKSYQYIIENAKSWSRYVNDNHSREEFYIWDLLSSMYITNKDLFDENIKGINSNIEDMKKGYLRSSNKGIKNMINIPKKVLDINQFSSIVYKAWNNII